MVVSVTILLLSLSGSISVILLFWHMKRLMELRKHGMTAPGIIEGIKVKKGNHREWAELRVRYCVNDMSYQRKFTSRVNKYNAGQQVEVLYLDKKPGFSEIKGQYRYLTSESVFMLLLFLALVYLLCIIGLICSDKQLNTDLLFIFVLFAAALCYYIDERNIRTKSETCSGKICYSTVVKDHRIVIADYAVGEMQYETKEMKVPVKHCRNTYSIGEPIEVKYRVKKPHQSIIAEDRYSLKQAKISLVLTCLYIIFYAAMFFIDSFSIIA